MEPMPYFDVVAKYYDEAYGASADLRDVEMYKSFARRFGGPVLEIGCGTGRVLKPIADMGIEIDGIDVSEAMISILKSKIADIIPIPNIYLSDMRRIEIARRYRLVTIPFRTLQHMITIEDKLQALAAAKNHLLDEGRLIFDVAFPNYESLASGVGGYVLSGIMLQPVRNITETASEISASNLSKRINYEGPHDELWSLSQTFDSMIDRLEHSFERQRQFVQDASHELRTPLAAIRTNIDVTEMDPDASVEEYRELVGTIKGQTERLTRLSEDLLLLTREDNESLEQEPLDLRALAGEVIRQLAPVAAARDVSLDLRPDGLAEAEANPDLVYRCVLNLVDNAIKYSGAGSSVTVTTESSAGRAIVRVADTGAGIAAEVFRIGMPACWLPSHIFLK